MRWNCYKKVSKSTFWRQHDYSKRQMDANGLNYFGKQKGIKICLYLVRGTVFNKWISLCYVISKVVPN